MNYDSFALYATNTDSDQITRLKKFLYNKYPYSSFHVFFDGDYRNSSDTSFLPSFYMKFYKGCIIFNSLSEYLKEHKNLLSSIIFILSSEELVNLPKNKHQNVEFIKLETEETL